MLAFALAAAVAAAPALSAPEAESAYRRMLEARYATRGTPVPAGGLEFEIDAARFRLDSGELRAMEPVAGGRVTGVVFRGSGTLILELPDSRELSHFRRVAELPDALRLEARFASLVLRDGGGLVERLAASAPGSGAGGFAPEPLALDRQTVWLERRLIDADAWVARSLAGDATEWAIADLDAGELGWLTVELDPMRAEELRVVKWRPDEMAGEVWVSLDRASERGVDGRPASGVPRAFDLLHAGIRADLTRPSKKYSRLGISRIQPRRARFEVELRLRPSRPEARTLSLELDATAELEAVRDERGAALPFLRDHVGARSSAIDDEVYDDTLIVLLPGPIGAGERRFTFVYELEILNYVSGREWYPGGEEAFTDPHTAEIELVALPKHDLRAMGRLVEEREEKERSVRLSVVERPTRMVTFSFAEQFEERKLEVAGAPPVTAFAARGGGGNKVYNVAADVTNAWRFYADRFGPGPEVPDLHVTSIIGGHGQAFEGFLHLAEPSWEIESRGPTELFRAHEVAHLWWGHLVGWASYRDQWLSEGFAEYSAMRFVEAAVEDGPKLYAEMVETFAATAMGEGKMSRFQRWFQPTRNPNQWRRVGAIAVGNRASTAEMPSGYYVQTYYRGALVLHMLRRLLAAKSGSDELFDSILAEFAREQRGRDASTAEFVALLSRRAPADWSWFFRQWVEEPAVPTWRWSWRGGRAPQGGAAVTIEVEQSGVPPGFRMPVPVRLELEGGAAKSVMLLIDEARELFTLPVERPAKRVELNPDLAVLARIEKR